MNWGNRIVIVFVAFASIVISMVTICMRQNVYLVNQNYYEEELIYQEQINRKNNFNQLSSKPTLIVANQHILLSFHSEQSQNVIEGDVLFFRPSDETMDQKHPLQLDSLGHQLFPKKSIESGLWKSKVRWTSQTGKEYYFEQTIFI